MKNETTNKELVAAGHELAKALGSASPLLNMAKLVSDLSTRLDCAIARGDALAAENATIKTMNDALSEELRGYESDGTFDGPIAHKLWHSNSETPATDAYLNSVRAEGIHFAANRILAAWKSCFIKATPAEAHDVSGAVLSALEFLPNARAEEFRRDYADQVRADIANLLRAGKDGE